MGRIQRNLHQTWEGCSSGGGKAVCALVCFIDAITAHAVGTPVGVGRVDVVEGALAPIPILHQIAGRSISSSPILGSVES